MPLIRMNLSYQPLEETVSPPTVEDEAPEKKEEETLLEAAIETEKIIRAGGNSFDDYRTPMIEQFGLEIDPFLKLFGLE